VNVKQFRSPANDHARMANGRGGRGFRLQSKLGNAIGVRRLEQILAEAQQRGTLSVP
jgi:hypothetical protein